MDLKKRLQSLDRLTRKPQEGASSKSSALRGQSSCEALKALELDSRKTPLGHVFWKDRRDELAFPGDPLPDLTSFFTQPGEPGIRPEDVLFLDTETTGLAGGTGTMAFVVGLAWWREGKLSTRQFFLPDPGGEAAMLTEVHRLAESFSAVATYNGASFDLPLLRTRALLNRLDEPWSEMLGWDLLVPSRRLWGRMLTDCRQQTVEKQVSAPPREAQDIPGQLIPQAWFDFLKGEDVHTMARVLYHNWRDMVGMAVIFREVTAWASRLAEAGCDRPASLQAWALARLAEARGAHDHSARLMTGAWEDCPAQFPHDQKIRFSRDAIRILKRTGDWQLMENVIAWVLASGNNDWWIHREAAILYEHRKVDLARARQHALAAGDDHRFQRICRKLKQGKETS